MPMFPQDYSRGLSSGILLIRILVGWVFLSEGIQKFLFQAALGTGRFAKIGIPPLFLIQISRIPMIGTARPTSFLV
jgi:uncharacterized membrane protein YphA (DoxX/SURF4 family)